MQTDRCQPFVTVVCPQGHLNASNANQFKDQLTAAVSSHQESILLVDMEQVESLDSAGLMSLVSALSLSRDLDRRFSLCSVLPSIRIIFELTQLDRVFEIFDDRAAFQSAIC